MMNVKPTIRRVTGFTVVVRCRCNRDSSCSICGGNGAIEPGTKAWEKAILFPTFRTELQRVLSKLMLLEGRETLPPVGTTTSSIRLPVVGAGKDEP